MTLAPGIKLGPYEIRSPLGAGGMGEVYRALDTRLGRDVALKILPEAFAADTERMARFEREAKILASLNHPNIASIYELEESNHRRALVMELVEGPSLAERIALGPVPVDEALSIAKQVCEGLEYAHDRGVVHRDLKPANVKVTPEGQVKILDFGLAKALDSADATASDPSSSPTLTRMATHAGIILGTAAYMSPEQAKGKPVDRRADIWAFGCLLYEMLTGKRAFDGETVSETLASVIKDEPDWSAPPPPVPPWIRALLKRCLTKDVRQRLQAIGDARITIDEVQNGADETNAIPGIAGAGRSSPWNRVVPWTVVAILVIALGIAFLVVPSRLGRPRGSVMHLNLAAQARHAESDMASSVAISQDGTQIAYVAVKTNPNREYGDLVSPQTATVGLMLRRLDQLAPTPLPDTTGGSAPFFAPDGRWIAFYADGALKKIPTDGGPPITLCQIPKLIGGSWGDDGFIYVALYGLAEIQRIAQEGGTPTTVVKVGKDDAVSSFRWPQMLPGSKSLLFTSSGAAWLSKHYKTEAYSLSTGKRTVVMDEGANARYLAPGYLVFTRGDILMGAPFDASSLKVTGTVVPLIQGITRDEWFGAADYALSSTGTLIYSTGGMQTDYRLVSVDMAGKIEPVGAQVRGFEDLSVSPDGNRVATTIVENGSADVWIYNRERDALTQLTEKGACGDPLWSPDGNRVVYTDPENLYIVPADAGSPPVSLNTGQWAEADSFSPDGSELVYSTFTPATQNAATWLLPMKPAAQPTRIFPDVPRVFDARFSPDGHWIAYASAQSGRTEVYVQAYPGPGARVQVSSGGGHQPLWSPNGSELYFRTPTKFFAADVTTRPALAVGKPRLLFEGNFVMSHHDYSLLPDGRHFIMIQPVGTEPPAELHVVVNWAEELKARLAAVGN
jgi:serine/threonine-protein kinase